MVLAGVMVCSLAACGGDKPSAGEDSAETKAEEATQTVDEGNSDSSSVMVYYGWGNSEDEEKYTTETIREKVEIGILNLEIEEVALGNEVTIELVLQELLDMQPEA